MVEYVQYQNFLDAQENKTLYELAIKSKPHFADAGVVDYSDNYPNWRSAKVIFHTDELAHHKEVLKEKIVAQYEQVCQAMQVEKLSDFGIDIQLTAHNDGDYFKAHRDVGTDNTNDRVLTFIYYFNKEPRPFTGGELVIHSTERTFIEPHNNMVVFFAPTLLHEVQLITCPDKAFENSRFTLNGWILKV